LIRFDVHSIVHPKAIPELRTTLNRDAVANHHSPFDRHVLGDIAIVAHLRNRKQVREALCACVGHNGRIVIDQKSGMNLGSFMNSHD